MILTGGYTNYGQDIGILMLDTIFPRMVGDIGNARTFPFPVRYKVVRGALPAKVVEQNDDRLLAAFMEGARELEAEGVKAITTSCGFLAVFQRELAAAVSVPVFTSSLLQVPTVEKTLDKGQNIVIVTANSTRLSARHLAGAGIDAGSRRHIIVGLEDKPEFYTTFVRQKATLDVTALEGEMEEAALAIRNRFPVAGAIVLECTNLSPFSGTFRQITGLPVLDIVTLICETHAAICGLRTPYMNLPGKGE
jgi:hypothetical protein